jgi:hypothetical protein
MIVARSLGFCIVALVDRLELDLPLVHREQLTRNGCRCKQCHRVGGTLNLVFLINAFASPWVSFLVNWQCE